MPAHNRNPKEVDELYGLEPVFEPGADGAARGVSLEAQAVQCPYCGEAFETVVDLSSGSTGYIEDCPVCCRPIELSIEVGADGALQSLEARRSD